MNARPLRTTLLALAVGMTFASGMAMAQDAPPPPPPGMHHDGPPPGGPQGPGAREHGPFGGPLFAGVTLTDAQRARIEAILHGNGDAQRARFKDVMKAHEDLEALAQSGHFDEAQAHRIAEAGAHAMADVAVAQARTESEVLAVLTPAQRAQVQANGEKLKQHRFGPDGGPQGDHGPRRGEGPHDGPPPGGPQGPNPGGPDDGR